MSQVFDVKQIPEMANYVGSNVEKKAVRGLQSAALRLVGHIKTVIIPGTPSAIVGSRQPVDRGIYKAGWTMTKLPNGAVVFNPVPYASVIDKGARAENIKVGRKMIDALTEWVRRHGLVSTKRPTMGASNGTSTKVKWVYRTNVEMVEACRAIAWAIAMSMKQRGIFNNGKGLQITERAKAKVPEFVAQEVARELRR